MANTHSPYKSRLRSLGGLPTIADISSTASSDLPKQFSQAKKAAIDGKIGKTTVLGVSLVDVEMIERGERQSRDMNYTSFAHCFVLAIGREGFRIYQAWGEHGYRLDEYLKRGGSQLRSWQEATTFLKSFRKLCHYSGPWTRELKDAYCTCFEIDLDSICGRRRLQAPIVPVYRPWVRTFEINDVQVEDIQKFR
ncbi:uncharacterized protein BO96DRAFT_492676 [Aspergillus niger CBS 101883]|uniref:uncharacterized protein n=1 Tax=Aspergillus lacticoffeatus (strain CBS 101883) TaxID=1450533 RepID=UPI000D800EDB|nr:uncharacterized protein BO96DRAFT_492676 [Aspergillus niger CBS 101883]PYH50219.1 hypothetical protein BO96DRAFT_492676 [Aspergillus niger CBS 101883]